MNMIDWLRASGEWMHKDRPDLYSTPHAGMMCLEEWVHTVRNYGESGSLDTGGLSLVYRLLEDGTEEWALNKKISSCDIFPDEAMANVYSWVGNSGTMIVAPNLPDVLAPLDSDDLDC